VQKQPINLGNIANEAFLSIKLHALKTTQILITKHVYFWLAIISDTYLCSYQKRIEIVITKEPAEWRRRVELKGLKG
jgi:hypothetical protein